MPNIPYTLNEFTIYNYQGIKETTLKDLPSDASWIFITGENGIGKTSLLRAIAIGLYGDSYDEDSGKLQLLNKNRGSKIELRVKRNNKRFWVAQNDEYQKIKVPVIAYGPIRIPSGAQRSTTQSNIKSLFSSNGDLFDNFEFEIERLSYTSKDMFKEVTNFFLQLMDNIKEINVKDKKVVFIENDEPKVEKTSDQLASGNRMLLTWIGDMLIRLGYDEYDDLSQIEGIVIIDEFDLHLHPKWQKRLPKLLSQQFPKVQFIASTHSPIPLLGAVENTVVIKVDRSKEGGIVVKRWDDKIPVNRLLPNAIFDSPIFNLEDLISSSISRDDLSKILTEDNFAEALFNFMLKEKVDKLKKKEDNE
ncbi:MAG: AAA family ATPase [Hyphomicrobiales bacterium]